MGDDTHLEYRHADGVLIVRPLLRILGPWDGIDDPPAEVIEFRDHLMRLVSAAGGPVLLDLSDYEYARNWTWFVPLIRECSGRGQRLAVWVRPAVAELFAVTKYDRLVPVRTTFAEAMVALGRGNPAEPSAAADGGA